MSDIQLAMEHTPNEAVGAARCLLPLAQLSPPACAHLTLYWQHTPAPGMQAKSRTRQLSFVGGVCTQWFAVPRGAATSG